MKRIVLIVLTLTISLFFVACSNDSKIKELEEEYSREEENYKNAYDDFLYWEEALEDCSPSLEQEFDIERLKAKSEMIRAKAKMDMIEDDLESLKK